MSRFLAYHGTTADFSAFDPAKTVDGGLHFGSKEQARMRGGQKARLIAVELSVERPRRSRDMGGNWASKIRSAKSAGHDAIVYLNRYEGIPLQRVLDAHRDGIDLDRLSDRAFRQRIPEAQDSWIVFDAEKVRILPAQTDAPPPALRPKRRT